MARAQCATTSYLGRGGADSNITGAFDYCPLKSDKFAWLFSYNHRETSQNASVYQGTKQAVLRDRYDTLSSDGLYQVSKNTEVSGRFSVRFNGNGNQTSIDTSSLTYLGQFRVERRIGDAFDIAGEGRILMQPSSKTLRQSFGAENGYWLTPDLRFGSGYNFTRSDAANSSNYPESKQFKSGAYLTITSKISNLFNLFGTSKSDFQNHLDDVKNSGKSQDLMHIVTKTGENLVWSYNNVRRLDDDGNIYILGSAQDVTELKRAETELKSSRRRFQMFLDNSPAIISLKDETGRFLFANEQYQKMFRQNATELLDKTVFDVMPENLAAEITEQDQIALQCGRTVESVLIIHDEQHLLNYKFPVETDACERFLGGIAIDITERQLLETELAAARDAALE